MKCSFKLFLLLFFGAAAWPFLAFTKTADNEDCYIEGLQEAKDKKEKLLIGGYCEVEGRLFEGSSPSKSSFLIRRARLFATGELHQLFGFMLMPRWDRHEEKVILHSAWLETLRPSWARMRIGLFKEPISLEALNAEAFLNFVERSVVVRTFCQIEDVGIMLYGECLKGRIAYSLGVFNGRGRELANHHQKEVVGRCVYRLFSSAAWGELYVGGAGSAGKMDEDLGGMHFLTQEDTPFWEWKKGVRARSSRLRGEIDVEWLAGPFYFSAEYLYANWGNLHSGSRSKLFWGQGGYVECSYLFTGEQKPRNQPVIPQHPFDPCKKTWGALELAVRYETFYASKRMMKAGYAKGANALHGWTFALNWYLNSSMLMRLDAQRLWFNRMVKLSSAPFHTQDVIVCRLQAFF